jgi:PTH1 family peptidyl-tRNA hydrolase
VGLFDFLGRLLGRGSRELSGLDPERTRVVVGLGNPGPEFSDTRHNLGFRCVDLLAKRFGAAWQDRTAGLSASVAVASVDDLTLVLAKPNTYMNRSGQAVRDLLEFLKQDPRRCMVVYDEMDLPFGALRLRERGSPGTHNGMRSIVSELHTDGIPRLRIGIGQSRPGEATSHVLGEFTSDEAEQVSLIVSRAADAVVTWGELGASVAMNRYNKA